MSSSPLSSGDGAPIAPTYLNKLAGLYILALPLFGFSLLNVAGRGLARPDWILGLLLTAAFALESLGARVKIVYSPANLFMALYFASGLFSAVMVMGATNTGQFIDFFTKAMQLVLVTPTFFVLSSLPVGEVEVKRLLKIWVLLGVVLALHAIYQLVAQVFDLPFATFTLTNPSIAVTGGVQSTRRLFGYTQPTSIFQEPSYLGAFLGPCLILAAVFLLEQRSTDLFFPQRWLNWLCVLALALAVLLSNSQAILVSLVVTLLFMLVRGLINRLCLLYFSALAVGAVLLLVPLLRAIGVDFLTAFVYRFQFLILNILQPYGSAQVTSYAERSGSLQLGLEIWQQYPLLGVGLGNMGHYNRWERATTNNAWMQLLVEQGIIGFVPFFLLFAVLWWQSGWLLRRHPPGSFWRTALIAMICVLALVSISGLFTFNWTDPVRVFVLGLANLIYVQANVQASVHRQDASARFALSAGRG